MQTKQKIILSFVRNTLARIEKLEQVLLTLLLTAMILLASFQIALRWLTSGGLVWIDPLLRYLVLWGGLVGAVFATAKGNHIALNVIDYLLTDRLKLWVKLGTHIFSAIVAGFLCRASILFIQSEIEFGGNSLFDVPTWIWNIIFPVAFGFICFHFVFGALLLLIDLRFHNPAIRPQ